MVCHCDAAEGIRPFPSRMLKTTFGFVLASLGASPYTSGPPGRPIFGSVCRCSLGTESCSVPSLRLALISNIGIPMAPVISQ